MAKLFYVDLKPGFVALCFFVFIMIDDSIPLNLIWVGSPKESPSTASEKWDLQPRGDVFGNTFFFFFLLVKMLFSWPVCTPLHSNPIIYATINRYYCSVKCVVKKAPCKLTYIEINCIVLQTRTYSGVTSALNLSGQELMLMVLHSMLCLLSQNMHVMKLRYTFRTAVLFLSRSWQGPMGWCMANRWENVLNSYGSVKWQLCPCYCISYVILCFSRWIVPI